MEKKSFKETWFDDTLILWIGIPLVGLIVPGIAYVMQGYTGMMLFSMCFFSLLGTFLLWMGCRYLLHKISQVFPWQKTPIKHLVADFLVISLYSFLVVCLLYGIALLLKLPYDYAKFPFWTNYFTTALISLAISLSHEGLYFFFQWKNALVRTERLEKENLLSQFETLKNQVNPHFLFNTLNTLIAIIEEDKEQAVEYVQKLSDFFRNILQFREKTVISIEEEIKLIKDYTFIQGKRYGDNFKLEIHISTDKLQTAIAPLTFQMLIENAIKHNIISTEKPLHIEISDRKTDYFIVSNNLQKRNNPEPGSGLGLENIKSRYQFLSDKSVEVIVTASNFTVAIPVLHKV